MTVAPIVVCENLVKIYKVAGLEVVALQGLDLSVDPGEMLGIVGASGSGKSTLMNILGGLDRPSAGKITVGGQNLLKLTNRGLDRYRRTRVGFIWQHGSRNLVPYLSALENIELPMVLAGVPVVEGRRRAHALLEQVGLSERAAHQLGQLSGGEQQRVAIAVALTNRPSLLLADEPTGEVDTATAQGLFQLFRTLNRELGLTILIVSHDPALARQVDRVVSIRDGKTSSETVRQTPVRAEEGVSGKAAEEQFEELTVLDSAGRLQIPKPLLERYAFQSRARLEPSEEGILVRPVINGSAPGAVEAQNAEPEAPAQLRWLQSMPWQRLQRIFRKRQS